MRRVLISVGVLTVVAIAGSASAQTAPEPPPGPRVERLMDLAERGNLSAACQLQDLQEAGVISGDKNWVRVAQFSSRSRSAARPYIVPGGAGDRRTNSLYRSRPGGFTLPVTIRTCENSSYRDLPRPLRGALR